MNEAATLRLAAPAKVNLGLRIVGRRGDGYHLLESFFVPLACPGPLCDEIEVSLAAGEGVALSLDAAAGAAVPAGPANLAHRAADAFLAEAGARRAVRLRLRKRIPAGAGLGGGSSDAGAVLRALARLLPGRVAPDRMRALALALGADVPFFLDPHPARVSGIGERVGPPEPVPGLPLLLVHPGKSLATAEVYAAWDERRDALTEGDPLPSIRGLRGAGGRLDRELLEGLLRNDLEPAATALCPGIARARGALAGVGAAGVGMTGSGPVVYGIFEEERERDEAERRLRASGGRSQGAPHGAGMRLYAGALAGAGPAA